MLPFLNPRKTVSVIVAKRGKPPGTEVAPEVEAPDHELDGSLKSAMEEFLQAVDSRSVIDMASAFKKAFEACEAEPHEEAEHNETEEEGEA